VAVVVAYVLSARLAPKPAAGDPEPAAAGHPEPQPAGRAAAPGNHPAA
jgi:hypothetical protein